MRFMCGGRTRAERKLLHRSLDILHRFRYEHRGIRLQYYDRSMDIAGLSVPSWNELFLMPAAQPVLGRIGLFYIDSSHYVSPCKRFSSLSHFHPTQILRFGHIELDLNPIVTGQRDCLNEIGRYHFLLLYGNGVKHIRPGKQPLVAFPDFLCHDLCLSRLLLKCVICSANWATVS